MTFGRPTHVVVSCAFVLTARKSSSRRSRDADAFSSSDEATRFVDGTLPNGLAFAGNGDILISNFGTDCLERMTRRGETTVMFDTVDGEPIGKVNFVCRDRRDRVWITVSTMIHDWPTAIRPGLFDGRVLLYEAGKEVRIVADDVQFRTNASSTRTRNSCMSRKRLAATSRAIASSPTAASATRRSSGRRIMVGSSTASRLMRSATSGERTSSMMASSRSRPRANGG